MKPALSPDDRRIVEIIVGRRQRMQETRAPSPLAGEGGLRSRPDEGYSAAEQSAASARVTRLREAMREGFAEFDEQMRIAIEATQTLVHAMSAAMRAGQKIRAEAQSFLIDEEPQP